MISYPFFIFGLFLGSLLNNIALRLEAEEPFIFARSKCPKCGKILRWFELIPIISFVWQKGRCRGCGGKISWRYPLTEILTGLFVYFLAAKILPLNSFNQGSYLLSPLAYFSFLYYLIFLSAFFILALLDWQTRYIDERVIYFSVIFWLTAAIINQLTRPNIVTVAFSGYFNDFFQLPPGPLGQIFTAFLATLPFLFLFLITFGRGMGLGDAKVAFMMGLFLRPGDLVLSFSLTILLGGLVSLFLLAKNRKMRQEISYVPFLFLGTLAAMFWGEEIVKIYFKIMQ